MSERGGNFGVEETQQHEGMNTFEDGKGSDEE